MVAAGISFCTSHSTERRNGISRSDAADVQGYGHRHEGIVEGPVPRGC